MQHLKLSAPIIFSAGLLLACSGNTATTADKDSTSTSAASADSGKDMYYEYTLTTAGKNATINGVTKMYISSKGDMRVEMNTSMTIAGNKNLVTIVIIGHSDKPDESIILDDAAKTYTINHINQNDLNTGEKIQSAVTKIGEEKMLGFNCVHAMIINKKSIGSSYSGVDTLDLWKSREVPIPTSVKELMDKFESKNNNLIYAPQADDQLKEMGCEGFMVKLEINTKNSSTQQVLTKVEHRDFAEAMFQIPAGYKEDKTGQ